MIHKDATPTFQWNTDKPEQNVSDLKNFLTEQIALSLSDKPAQGRKPDLFAHLTQDIHFHVIIFLEPGYTREMCCSIGFHEVPKELRDLRGYIMAQVKMGCVELITDSKNPAIEKVILTSITKKNSDFEYFVATSLMQGINYFESQLLESLGLD